MRIAMASTRFAGLDGVSLETAKVAEALERAGHDVVWFAGMLGPEFGPGTEYPAAFFGTDENLDLERRAFGGGDPEVVRRDVDRRAADIAEAFDAFLDEHHPDVLVVQNAWAIPMQLPLAVALADVADRRQLPSVGHHHDFAWERRRFAEPVVPDVLERVFPPTGPRIGHVVINQDARDELARRRGAQALVLPNVMDFEAGPPPTDGGDEFRELAGLSGDEIVLLQPTRVIPRKGIELSIDLASRIDGDPVLIVTHPDDLDPVYWKRLKDHALAHEVDLRLVDAGRSREALGSAYAAADLVCFPSLYEGYGNALVEALYFRRPLFVNRYSVFVRDIARHGITGIEIDGEVTDEAVQTANLWIRDPSESRSVIETNARAGIEHLSYRTVVETFDEAFATANRA